MPATAEIRPRKQPRQQRSQATVNAILDATAHILVSGGYAGLNTNRVAERAGASIGSLYQYFPSKAALIAALRRRHAEETRTLLLNSAALLVGQPLDKAVRTLVGAVIQAHRLAPELHRVLEQEVPRPEELDGRSDLNTDLRAMLKSLLARYRNEIRVRKLDLTCLVLVRIVDTLAHTALLDDELGVNRRDIEREIAVVVLRYLRGAG